MSWGTTVPIPFNGRFDNTGVSSASGTYPTRQWTITGTFVDNIGVYTLTDGIAGDTFVDANRNDFQVVSIISPTQFTVEERPFDIPAGPLISQPAFGAGVLFRPSENYDITLWTRDTSGITETLKEYLTMRMAVKLDSILGPTGEAQFTGPQGPQGVGVIGQIGESGVQGETGFQGVQGVQGETGDSPIGQMGVQGSQGETGISGTAGPEGIQGPQGVGAQGPSLECDGNGNLIEENFTVIGSRNTVYQCILPSPLSTGNNNVIIGKYAGGTYDNSGRICIGTEPQTGDIGNYSIAIVANLSSGTTKSTGEKTIHIGNFDLGTNQGNNSIAIGRRVAATVNQGGERCICISGATGSTLTQGDDSIIISSNARTPNQGKHVIDIGFDGGGPIGNYAINIGTQSVSVHSFIGAHTVAIQQGRNTMGTNSVAILSIGCGDESVVLGENVRTNVGIPSPNYSVNIGADGSGLSSVGDFTVACGPDVGSSSLIGSIGLGNDSRELGEYTVGIGGGNFKLNTTKGVFIGHRITAFTNILSGNIAIGYRANGFRQPAGNNTIAIGRNSGGYSQQQGAIAIGFFSSFTNQGQNSINIGQRLHSSQRNNSIVLNANYSIVASTQNSFYVNPIRSTPSAGLSELAYDTVNKEITYDTSKTFVINHPLHRDKYLVHGCIEGPEAGVYYRGSGEIKCGTDSTTIKLPNYVKKLADNFTVQLTPVFEDTLILNDEVIILNSSLVVDNKFTVYGKPGKFYWVVFGTRCRINVNIPKTDIKINRDGPYTWIDST